MLTNPPLYGSLPIGAVMPYVAPTAATTSNIVLLSPRDSDAATISRSVLASSTGSAIAWAVADAPVYVFSAPLATWMKHMALGGRATARPAWLPRGGVWLDESDAGAWSTTRAVDYLYNGTGDVERGRHEASASIYVPSARNLWVDKGAANYTVTAHDVGKVLVFDTTAAARTLTLIAGASFGHGATLWFLGSGGATNGVLLTPSGSEAIDAGANGASLTVVPNRLTRVSWDAAKSKWRTDYTDYRAAIILLVTSIRPLTVDSGSSRSVYCRSMPLRMRCRTPPVRTFANRSTSSGLSTPPTLMTSPSSRRSHA
ncbi:MAG: hypothetical protein WCJ41_20615 [Aestuariivirga sp.]|uniref:hypothetical protein n=1 Tax=Aestuariivirga sp. TaxID=2650926 RepID=UPI00301775D3